jgi:hypothetical protein
VMRKITDHISLIVSRNAHVLVRIQGLDLVEHSRQNRRTSLETVRE